MLELKPKHQKIVSDILAKYPYTFYAFGSRTKGNAKKYSDLDLGFLGDMPLATQAYLEEDFEESDLPFIVELVSLDGCDTEFKKRIKQDLVLIKSSEASDKAC